MITVLSLNTAIDRIWAVDGLTRGAVQRATYARAFAGGKALNVARVLRQLGESVRVVGFLGGEPAEMIRRSCTRHGIEQRWIATAADSRTCVIVVDTAAATQTVINEIGPTVGPPEIDALHAEIWNCCRRGDILSISGSTPPGTPVDFYAELVRESREREVRVLIDTGGETLRRTLPERPWAVSPNAEECGLALGSDGDGARLAEQLGAFAQNSFVTAGSDGAFFVSENAQVQIKPPRVQSVNAVGSGDAFVAGFLSGTVRGLPSATTLRLAAACGAANAARLEPGIGSAGELESLLERATIEPLPRSSGAA